MHITIVLEPKRVNHTLRVPAAHCTALRPIVSRRNNYYSGECSCDTHNICCTCHRALVLQHCAKGRRAIILKRETFSSRYDKRISVIRFSSVIIVGDVFFFCDWGIRHEFILQDASFRFLKNNIHVTKNTRENKFRVMSRDVHKRIIISFSRKTAAVVFY